MLDHIALAAPKIRKPECLKGFREIDRGRINRHWDFRIEENLDSW
jgi:hypothetical protein